MSFQSTSQRKFMYSQHPEIAKEWEKHTPENKKLPERKNKLSAITRKLDSLKNQ